MTSNPNPNKCNMSPTDIMNKIYEIVSILQTLQTLIKQLNKMCLKSLFRYLFGLFFFFAPQLNPYVWADAYEEAMKHREEQQRAARADTAKPSVTATGRDSVPSNDVDGAYELQKLPGRESVASPAL
ncbi:hypothetical protein F503_02265 [Ophiostoma piceae UAMH 11346]|uniref:Uncharacterized protein n=1 Tax=Ophiostoma piceae (strain UAMH 11346) TaxID=1262450 RepID=S3C1C9_OPHP1|nr:hypothetical protein F503_02265 [Ophiostoma piceae UAMH 11346]